MKLRKPMDAQLAVFEIVAALSKLGFGRAFRSRTGSHYLRYRGLPFQLRVSDHKFSGFSRQRQAQVVCSFVVRDGMTSDEVPGFALATAVRFLFLARLRMGLVRGKQAVPA